MTREREMPAARRPIVLIAIAVFVGALGAQHLVQAILALRGEGDPMLLVLEHIDIGIFSLLAAYALWTAKPWAPWALAVAGLATAALVVSLGPLLKMDSTERSGLWAGAASITVITAVGVWYVRRRVAHLSSRGA